MLQAIPYLVYVLGPFGLAVVIARRLRSSLPPKPPGLWWAFALGFPTFLVAWVGSTAAMTAATATRAGPLLIAVVVSAAAGVFEETARFLAFRYLPPLRERRDWPHGVLFAAGHSGMESLIVAGSLALTVIVVTRAPELLPADVRAESEAVLATPFWQQLYGAVERVTVGFVIHATFTSVVLLSFHRSRWFLLAAILWHFGHDMIGFNLHRVSTHWTAHAAWIGFILIVYGAVVLRLRRSLPPDSRPAPRGT